MSEKIYTIEEIKKILSEILKDKPVYQVILFGSYAKKNATKDSDIDLIIDTKSKLKGFALLKLICQIEEKLQKEIDGFEKYEIVENSLIDKEIRKTGVIVYENKEYMSLKKMIEYINKALKYTEGCSFETFSRNEEKVDATVFAISQIGELVKNITKETMERYNNIEWIIIKNLRNKIVHDYEGINLNLIWDIITDDIIQLKMDLEKY